MYREVNAVIYNVYIKVGETSQADKGMILFICYVNIKSWTQTTEKCCQYLWVGEIGRREIKPVIIRKLDLF